MTMFTEMTIIARLLMIMIIVVMMTMTISMMMMMVVNKDDDERNGDGRDDAKRKDEADFYPNVLQVSQSSCVSLSSLSSITGIPSGSTSQANSVKRLWICVRGKKLNRVSDYEKKNYPPLPRWIFFTVGNSEILRKSSEQHAINIANYG